MTGLWLSPVTIQLPPPKDLVGWGEQILLVHNLRSSCMTLPWWQSYLNKCLLKLPALVESHYIQVANLRYIISLQTPYLPALGDDIYYDTSKAATKISWLMFVEKVARLSVLIFKWRILFMLTFLVA